MSDVNRLVPGRTLLQFKKEAFHKLQLYEKEFDNILGTGIVIAADYYGNKENGVAPYSLKVKLDKRFDNLGNDKFIPPLLPIHNIVLPQVGEEVLVLFVTPGAKSQAFWISRINYNSEFSSNSINTININELYSDKSTSELQKEQLLGPGTKNTDIKEKLDIEPQNNYKVPIMRIKPGDVVTHGRSNTHLIHTFDVKNKKGMIDLVTEVSEPKNNFYEQEVSISKGSRVLLTTERNLDKEVLEKDLSLTFDDKYTKNESDTSYALIQSDEIRLISNRGKEINHIILAEKHAVWTENFINIVKDYIDKSNKYIDDLHSTLQSLAGNYDTHVHGTPIGPTTPTPGLLTPIVTNKLTILENDKQQLDNIKNDLDNHFNKINESFSEKVACN